MMKLIIISVAKKLTWKNHSFLSGNSHNKTLHIFELKISKMSMCISNTYKIFTTRKFTILQILSNLFRIHKEIEKCVNMLKNISLNCNLFYQSIVFHLIIIFNVAL